MQKIILKTGMAILILFLFGAGCNEKEDLQPNHAIGTIIEVTGECNGEVVLIEVDNPKGIGISGTFSAIGNESKGTTYQNAIGIPYFFKVGISDSVPQTVGTRLYFEYRELTEEEREDSKLFSTDPPIMCPAIYGPPSAVYLMITKVISYE